LRFQLVFAFIPFLLSIVLYGQLEDDEKVIPSTSLNSEASDAVESIHEKYYQPSARYFDSVNSTLFLRHLGPRGPGYDTGYTTIGGIFFPGGLACNTIWPFVDLRAHYFNDNEWAANAGGGIRYAPCDCCYVFGFNAYFDYRMSNRRRFHYTQAGVGVEILGPCWDIRINGYWPIRDRHTKQKCFFTYPGDFFIKRDKLEGAYRGVDGEIGRYFSYTCCGYVYAGLGPYYYRGECNDVTGGRLRIFFDYCRHITLGGIFYYDNRFGFQVQGLIGFHFAIGCAPKCCRKEESISQPVFRNEIIFLDEFCKWKSNY